MVTNANGSEVDSYPTLAVHTATAGSGHYTDSHL